MPLRRAAAQVDEQRERLRSRRLDKMCYLYPDGRYEKVRIDGQVRDAVVLAAMALARLQPSLAVSRLQ